MASAPEPALSTTPPPAPARPPGPALSGPPSDRLRQVAAMPPLQVLRLMESSLAGLDEAQAQLRASRVDWDAAAPRRPRGWLTRIARALVNPFVLVPLCLAATSAATADLPLAAVIVTLAATSCALQVRQEQRSDRAAAAQPAVTCTVTVVRRPRPGAPGVAREVPTDQLVPGDVVRLVPGEAVPADIRLLRSGDLMVNQSLLTGESSPALKHASLDGLDAGPTAGPTTTIADDPRLCLMGATVVGGSGTGVVVATGDDTCFGHLCRDGRGTPRGGGTTAFDRGVREVSRILVRVTLATVPVVVAVLAVNAFAGADWQWALLFAVSVAVGLTPETLPVVTTTVLARAAAALRRHGVIVKQLPAIHNLGAMDVLCTDKTGTLTEERSTVACCLDAAGVPDTTVLGWAALAGQVHADRLGPLHSDPLDEALIRRARELGLGFDEGTVGVEAFGFDVTRRRSTAVVRRTGAAGVETIIVKGAAEGVLGSCTRVRSGGAEMPMSAAARHRLEELADRLHHDGIRVMAVATGPRRGRRAAAGERDLTLVGYIGLRDELRRGVPAALAALAAQGVGVKLITGDDPRIAARICRAAGLPSGRPVLGNELDPLDDAALTELAEHTTVFARMDPRQKARVVTALRGAGHTVGYLGDGLNDAHALRAADVGICVANAAPIARASADVVLARKDLAALGGAIALARRAFLNIIKHIKITVAANVGHLASVVAARALLPFLPILPPQILAQKLLFDVSQLVLAFDHTDEEVQRRPRTFDGRDLVRFVVCFGLINFLAHLAAFGVLRHLLGARPGTSTMLFHTGWFLANLFTQVLAVHLLRGRGGVRRWSWGSRPVVVTSLAIIVAAVAVTAGPLARLLGFDALPAAYFGWLAVVLVAFCATTLAGKFAYQRTVRAWM